MKKILVFIIVMNLPLLTKAQYVDSLKTYSKYPNHIWQGNVVISAFFTKANKYKVNSAPYGTQGGEFNLGYYVFDRFGLESGISTDHYNYLITNQPDPNQIDNNNLILLNERIRYHFYQQPHFGTVYLQTGYSYGWFDNGTSMKIHRWEVATLGLRGSFTRQFIPNLDFEECVSLNKAKNSSVSVLIKLGLSYYLGSLRKQNQ